ncbi:MAG: bifunctional 4-hydroxy-2-oxoglutarate aldolase/2-dehydro-3-deoxy-phosphogluconate aldolase [Cyanobacteria bacterium J06642_9]
MDRQAWCGLVRQAKAIAVVRAPSFETGVAMAKAVAQGGLTLIEITWNSPQPETLVETLSASLPHCTIGTGTLLTLTDLKRAIAAGAKFCFSPHTDPTLIDYAGTCNLPFIPGALTPSEIVTAWQAGAASVKIFPISVMGGPVYLKALQGPLGHIPLIPTGGVTTTNAPDLLTSGAIAVGVSSDLFPQAALRQGDWDAIAHKAANLRRNLGVEP